MFNGCLPSSPRVPGQLRTHFARSSFLLDVLWQHLVEQRKNCTAPWHEMLLLLISSLPKALQRQRLTAGAGRGPIRGPASRLPARLYSVHFYCFQAENTHCCTGKSSLAGTRKLNCNFSLTGGFSLGCAQKAASVILPAIKQAFTERFWVIMVP